MSALVVNIMFEQWDEGVAPGLGPMGNPLPGGAVDHQAISWADYGWRTGVWAALDRLERDGVRATFYASGILTETAPDALRAIVGAGHELAGHSWAQNRIPAMIDAAAEADEIERCTTAIEHVTGARPVGWISPRCTPSASTSQLLAAAGYAWHGDVFDAEVPYWRRTEEGPIVALPFGMEINDLPMTVRYGQPTRELIDSYAFAAEALDAAGRDGYVDVTLHAHVGCRPAGLLALARIIEHARGLGHEIVTRAELADRFRRAEPAD